MEKYRRMIQKTAFLGFFLVIAFAVISFRGAVPDRIYVKMGEPVTYDFHVPARFVLKEDSAEVFDSLAGQETSSYCVSCRLFGVFPVKDVEVVLVKPETVYASGMPIGIYAKTKGVLIIGTSGVKDAAGMEQHPAENLVKGGDYIVSVNGVKVDQKEELAKQIQEYGGGKETLGIFRNEEYIEVALHPVQTDEGKYLLGIWVRDDLAGIGTLTYYRKNGEYGALGHAISDGDTGTRMRMEKGAVYDTDIIGIRKGEKGNPGELSGVIEYAKERRLGSITENTPLGIHGILDADRKECEAGCPYEIQYKQNIHTGTADILSSISGEPRQYEIWIEHLDYSDTEENKGILFRVTDRELLERTGGIVQGMSGSPIIQDGRLIGAVTHVFVSDASRGYGIFIEKML